jgi:hypothetical protein
MKGNDKPYLERIKTNLGEELFISYCNAKGYKINRLGFDERAGYVENFFNLNPLLRNLPDFVVNTPNETFVVCVKGTANLKKQEFDLLPLMIEWFSSKKAPLVYAFCFDDREKPALVYPEKVIELYQKAKEKRYESDGVIYRSLAV